MGALVASINVLSTYHPDANPALKVNIWTSTIVCATSSSEPCGLINPGHDLQGQDLYKSKSVRDKQIVRILGKVVPSKSVHLLPWWCTSCISLTNSRAIHIGSYHSSCNIFKDGWETSCCSIEYSLLFRKLPLYAWLYVSIISFLELMDYSSWVSLTFDVIVTLL